MSFSPKFHYPVTYLIYDDDIDAKFVSRNLLLPKLKSKKKAKSKLEQKNNHLTFNFLGKSQTI